MTEDQSRVRGERERDEQQTERIDGGPQEEIENFLDTQSLDDGAVVADEDAPQANGTAEEVSDVPQEEPQRSEVFQEQRGRTTEKKRLAGVDSSKISSCTRSKAERSHSPLVSLLHSNTDCHFPLSSSVAPYPLFTICAVAKPGLMNRVKDGIWSGRDAIVCFSSQLAKFAMSEWKSTPKSSDGQSPSSRTKTQADQQAEAKRKDALEKLAEERV